MAETVGTVSAVTSLAEQSLSVLDHIQKTLEHRKSFSMHLSTVMRDVEGTKSIIQRIKNSPFLQSQDLDAFIKELLDISQKIEDLVTNQEALTATGSGFRLFVHDFMKGPGEQKQLETFRDNLVASKNSLILAVVVDLVPAGTTLSVTNTKLSGMAYMQNGRILRNKDDKDFDNIVVKDVVMEDSSMVMNSALTEKQLDRLTSEHNERARLKLLQQTRQSRLEALTAMMQIPDIPSEMMTAMINGMNELLTGGL